MKRSLRNFPMEIIKELKNTEQYKMVDSYVSEYGLEEGRKRLYNKLGALFKTLKLNVGESTARTNLNGVSVIASWSRTKQIYRFNDKLVELLGTVDDVETIPVETLKNRPYDDFYLEPANCFVHIYNDDELVKIETVKKVGDDFDARYESAILKDGDTLKSALSKSYQYQLDEMKMLSGTQWHGDIPYMPLDDIKNVLPQILYLCAVNADIKSPRGDYEKPPKRKKSAAPKKPYMWAVGDVVVRQYIKASGWSQSESANTGRRLRPHIRKGHWHHYWRGKRGEEKTLILKWAMPTFVNSDLGEIPTVINEV